MHNSNPYLELIVQENCEGAGRPLQVALKASNWSPLYTDEEHFSFKAALYPTDVAQIITEALRKGWDPSVNKKFSLETPLTLTEFSLRSEDFDE